MNKQNDKKPSHVQLVDMTSGHRARVFINADGLPQLLAKPQAVWWRIDTLIAMAHWVDEAPLSVN